MMNNIFNQFDPSNSMINPIILTMMLTFLANSTEMKPSMNLTSKILMTMNFLKENKNNMMSNNMKMTNPLISNILITISTINLSSLTIYSWSNTSQISNNIPLIFLSWIPILLMILINKKKNFLTHLIPQSTPYILIPFMFMIELISFMIRPLTLMMRLTANMIAGHIMINLSSNLISQTPMILTIPSISISLLMIMEMIVAILQAYIIMTLISMFISEI